MAKMSDSEVLAYADKLCKMVTADSPARKKEYCKFISHSKDRYCNASTHQNCNRCRFFEPTVMARLRVLVEENTNLQKENNSLTKKLNRMSEELAIAEETINYYREEIWGEKDGQATDGKESASNTDGKEDVDGEVGEDS